MRHHQIRCPLRRLETSFVPIEAEHRGIGHPPEQLQMFLGQRRAQRGYCALEARRHGSDHIEIAFHDDDSAAIARRLACRLPVVERLPFVEEFGLGRVEILRRHV
ncbi:hypothetical protein D3C72_1788510 [compost metagenome]